jgi:hypothetical protein
MKQPDFKYLPPEVQQNFQRKKLMHQQLEAERLRKIQLAQSGFIPTDGPMIACDMYVENPDPTKAPKRARIPQKAVDWLMKKLESQGDTLDRLENMNRGAMAEMAQMLTKNRPAQGMPQGQGPAPMPQLGQARPMGAMQ